VSHEPRKVDAIFLPGGSFPAPPERAAELYLQGYAPLLVPSGGVSCKTGKFNGVKNKQDIYDGDYQTDCDFYTDVLLKNGVAPSAIVGEDKSSWTKENALFTKLLLEEKGIAIESAIIVCKSTHARRCLMFYQLAFPTADIFVCPADERGISRDNWHESNDGIERVLGELSRCGNQFDGKTEWSMNLFNEIAP